MFDFIIYLKDFYGNGGIYDMGADDMQILMATEKHIKNVGFYGKNNDGGFSADSRDREMIRDILISDFGLVHPNA